jgi:hypothetical protein
MRISPSVFVLGGNASTLAFTSSLRPEDDQISSWLVPLAWTPIGVSLGETWQRVSIPAEGLAAWVDQTFPPEDERSFLGSLRDIELLKRLGWHAEVPSALSEGAIINIDDVPEELLESLSEPLVEIVQCATCRRLCVRTDFVWNDRRLCAWDFHSTVFGRRGPWRNEAYAPRHFETIPNPRYLVPALLEEESVEIIASLGGIPAELQQRLVNAIIEGLPGPAYLAAKTGEGITLLRERAQGVRAD